MSENGENVDAKYRKGVELAMELRFKNNATIYK